MKPLILAIITWISVCFTSFGQGFRTADPNNLAVNYLDSTQVINSYLFLPSYPKEGTAEWLRDVQEYIKGKQLTDTARVNLAIRDAYLHEGLATAFNIVFPIQISWENTPAIYYLITHAREDAGGLATKDAKGGYRRLRPFELFNEHTRIPEVEPEYIGTGSYPSGHSAIGWLTALILSEIAPEYAFGIMQRGYEIGQSRVLLGFHFQSDVDAGRLLASMVYPILMNNAEFRADMDAAKAEYQRLMNGK